MIKALNIASQGLQQAERRATSLASEILKDTSDAFSLPDESSQTAPEGKAPPVSAPSGPGYSDILQKMVDLKAEQRAFQANATVFKRLDDAQDDALGAMFDDES